MKNETVASPSRPSRKEMISFWHDMRQYADLRDLESFAQLGDEFSKKDYEQRLASVRESMRTVEGNLRTPT